MAQWLAESWKEFYENGGQGRINSAFQRTALLIAHDGSENNLVKIQGVDDYVFDPDSSESESESEGESESESESVSESGGESENKSENGSGSDVEMD